MDWRWIMHWKSDVYAAGVAFWLDPLPAAPTAAIPVVEKSHFRQGGFMGGFKPLECPRKEWRWIGRRSQTGIATHIHRSLQPPASLREPAVISCDFAPSVLDSQLHLANNLVLS